jgi:hypothetical protein
MILGARIGFLVLLLVGCSTSAPPPQATDPLEYFYGNTLVCLASESGEDACHLWLNRDGSFLIADVTGGHAGHYRVGPERADGQVPVCLYWDTPNIISPAELPPPAPQQPRSYRGAPGQRPPGPPPPMLCRTENFRTQCSAVDDLTSLSDPDRIIANRTMGERFHHGMCYPLGGQQRKPGAVWFETDVPLPAQGGRDKLMLLEGRR